MTYTFTKRLGAGICAMAFCFCAVFGTSAVYAAQTAGASSVQSVIQSGVSGAARGLDQVSSGASAVSGAVTSVSGAAGALGLEGAGNVAGTVSDVTNALSQGKDYLNTAGKIAGTDFGSLFDGAGNFDYKGLSDTFTKLGSNTAGAITDIAGNIGKNFNSVLGINTDGLYGSVTNWVKDISPEIKELMSLKLSDMNLETLSNLFAAGGFPVTMVDLNPVQVLTVTSAVAQTGAAEEQYGAEVDYTAALGPEGIMDGRFGECNIGGEDVSGAINAWIAGPGYKNEGMYRNLYLDTECWATVGMGSVLKEYSSAGNWEGYKRYFLSFDYEDWNGNPLGKDVQEEDLRLIFDMEQTCRACGLGLKRCLGNYGGGAKFWRETVTVNGKTKPGLKGRITEQSALNAAFKEICDHHVKRWYNKWKQSGTTFSSLPVQHQLATIDISFQGGSGTISGCSKCTMNTNYSTPYRNALAQGNCSAAISAFSGAPLCTQYSNRCQERKTLLGAACGG